MTTRDFSNQIGNLLVRYLPYTDTTLGNNIIATSLSILGNSLILTLNSADYTLLSSKINDIANPRDNYSIRGLNLKNNIVNFSGYPQNTYPPAFFGFQAKFKKKHNFYKNQIVPLKDFTNSIYNISYKISRIISPKEAVLIPTTPIIISEVTTGLGFHPTEYNTGFNNIQTLLDLGPNQVSFDFDPNLSFTTDDINDIDLSFSVSISDFLDNVKVIALETFLRNLVNQENTEYLVIDTTSLKGTPLRSKSNTTDANYSSYSCSGFFDILYTLDINYILERKSNDSDNQTDSGSDISFKQLEMYDTLTSVLRGVLPSDNKRLISAITINNNEVTKYNSEGSTIITYTLSFISSYLPPILIKKDHDNTYPIDFVKINSDVIDFS